jgi:hypothetical protein
MGGREVAVDVNFTTISWAFDEFMTIFGRAKSLNFPTDCFLTCEINATDIPLIARLSAAGRTARTVYNIA